MSFVFGSSSLMVSSLVRNICEREQSHGESACLGVLRAAHPLRGRIVGG